MPRYFRKVIRITAEDSPNVKWARTEQAHGVPVSNAIQIPGVLPWEDYQARRKLWDPVQQTIGLDALFWEGAEFLFFPPQWLARANELAAQRGPALADKWLGVDPGEGGDSSAWVVIDRLGLLHLVSLPTADTVQVVNRTLALMREYHIPAHRVLFDRGGGGKEHADRLRSQGQDVRTISFGESATPAPRRGLTPLEERREAKEERGAYLNKRAEMYGNLSELLNPALGTGWSIPAEYHELVRQLALIPKLYDNEGKIMLPPKNKRAEMLQAGKSKIVTLRSILGRSPDEADALVLAVECMTARTIKSKVVVD